MERLAAAGKPVGILRDQSARAPLAGPALSEAARLDEHLRSFAYDRALVLGYENLGQLAEHVDAFINRAISQLQQRVEDDLGRLPLDDAPSRAGAGGPISSAAPTGPDPTRGVWPRVESTERVESDSRGRIKTRRNWYLVLSNQTGGPARNVRYEYLLGENEHFDMMGPPAVIPLMPPAGEVRYPLFLSASSTSQAQCRVTWEDNNGDEQVTEATVTT